MNTTTVIDTIHTIVYDTIHTISFDTVHTTVFDTIHSISSDTIHSLVYDTAAVTLQTLRDSQTFYSNHFIALITVAGIAAAAIIFIATKMWDKKVEVEVEKLKNDCKKLSEDVVNNALKTAEERFKTAAKNELGTMKKESAELLKKEVFSKFDILDRTRDPVLILSELSSLLNKVKYDVDDELMDFIISNILPKIEWSLNEAEQLGFSDGTGSFMLGVKEKLGWFVETLLSATVDAEKKKLVIKNIGELDSKLTQILDELFDVKRGGATKQSGRFHISKKARLGR